MNLTELSRQAGFDAHHAGFATRLSSFAALVIEARDRELLGVDMEPVAYAQKNHEYISLFPDKYHTEPIYTADQLAAAVLRERERCAQVCEELQDATDRHKWPTPYGCAAAIRGKA